MSLTNTKTGFSVKDILDLPDTNDEEGSITGTEEDTEGSESTKTPGVLVQSPIENVQNLPLKNPFYDNTDNPYTRWLATTDTIQYSCKYCSRIPSSFPAPALIVHSHPQLYLMSVLNCVAYNIRFS